MNNAIADPLADLPSEETPPVEPDEETLSGYNPSDGEEPLGGDPEPPEEDTDEPEFAPENPDDVPAGPSPEEEEYEVEGTAEADTSATVEEDQAEQEVGEQESGPQVDQPDPEVSGDPDPVSEDNTQHLAGLETVHPQSRVYLILEEETGNNRVGYFPVEECLYAEDHPRRFVDGKDGEKRTGEIEARNAENARRAAYKRIIASREDDVVVLPLVAVSARQFRPKRIGPRHRNRPSAFQED